jgi:sulfide:quinone oxidoreductase
MQAKRINDTLTVCPQISPADVAEIAAMGFGAIICNRPDGEAGDQPAFAEIAAAAAAAGIKTAYQPITPGHLGQNEARAFAQLTRDLPQPVFAYCRTGTRSITLWALSQADTGRAGDEIAAEAAQAGYDVTAALRAAV